MIRSCLLSNLVNARKILCNSYSCQQKKSLTYSQWKQTRHFSTPNSKKPNEKLEDEKKEDNLTLVVDTKLKPFDDKDAQIIFDVDEEQELLRAEALAEEEPDRDPFEGLNVKRGVRGVFDIEDLVEVLKKDKARNIFVASVPVDYAYVDYMVVASAKSKRHMLALATFVRKLYKFKRNPTDLIPDMEGKNSNDWIAMDLGNIALHILSDESRKKYDLETLWAVGPEYDDLCNFTEEVEDIMDQYNTFIADLQPQVSAEQKEDKKTR